MISVLAAGALLSGALAQEPARPITLPEAFGLALKRSEVIAQDDEAVNLALARVEELKSDIMPHLAILGSETLQENPRQAISSINQTAIPLVSLTLTQPLFSGFREFIAYKAGKKQAESAQLTKKRAESLLYQDVAQAYLSLLQVQSEILIRSSVLKETNDRIGQLEHWVRIGRSRESEVLAARSLLAQTEAQVEIARGEELVAQELLRFLTGLDESDFVPQPLAPIVLEAMDPYLSRARSRDDVQARGRDVESADLLTSVARRQRWGSIGLTGDYYLERTGFNSNVHYDAIFGLTLPIFDGGTISAQVREQEAMKRSADQALSLAQRSAEREVRSSFKNMQSALASVAALQKAADLAEANVKAQEQDYRLSLVTNLDVLDSLNTLQSTKLQLNAAQQQAQFSRAQLEVAAGGPQR